MEKAVGRGAGGGEPEPRCGAEDCAGSHTLPRERSHRTDGGHLCKLVRQSVTPCLSSPHVLFPPGPAAEAGLTVTLPITSVHIYIFCFCDCRWKKDINQILYIL